MGRRLLLILGFLFTANGPVSGGELPCVIPRMDQVNAQVQARVAPSGGDLGYQYRLENRVPSSQRLVKFAVQASAAGGAPVAQTSPPRWQGGGRIVDTDFHVWDTFEEPRGLAAGMSATGFGLSHASLPAIVRFLAWGEVDVPTFPEGRAPSSCEGDDLLENSFKGSTIGPNPPSQDFVPIEFLNYLITLLHGSRQAGWIKVDGVHQSLLAKLKDAKRKLEAGDIKVAKNVLNAFLNQVRATSCQDFTCPGNKPLTSEAYALLFFNGQFLFDRLAPPA
jgi:hypothetical protein